MRERELTDRQADIWLALAALTWLIEAYVSPHVSYALRVIIGCVAVFKCDVRLLPALFVSSLNGYYLYPFTSVTVKLAGLTSNNVVLMWMFLLCAYKWLKSRVYDGSMKFMFLLGALAFIPAIVMALEARASCVAFWATPISYCLTTGLFFWGILLGRSWDFGKTYLVKRLIIVFLVVNVLMRFRFLKLFTFSEQPIIFVLTLCSLGMRDMKKWTILGVVGSVFALLSLLFSRMENVAEGITFGSTSGSLADVGSTFTRLSVAVLSVLFCIWFRKMKPSRYAIRGVPRLMLLGCIILFFIAVVRTKNGFGDKIGGKYDSFVERFEFKLYGDRGQVWLDAIETELFKPPYFIKELREQRAVNHVTTRIAEGVWQTDAVEGIRLLPHNQFLTLVCRSGWWLGLTCFILLVWMVFRAIDDYAEWMWKDVLLGSLCLPTAVAIFLIVGLSGQSVWDHAIAENGMAVLIFCGLVCGVIRTARLREYFWRRQYLRRFP